MLYQSNTPPTRTTGTAKGISQTKLTKRELDKPGTWSWSVTKGYTVADQRWDSMEAAATVGIRSGRLSIENIWMIVPCRIHSVFDLAQCDRYCVYFLNEWRAWRPIARWDLVTRTVLHGCRAGIATFPDAWYSIISMLSLLKGYQGTLRDGRRHGGRRIMVSP